MTIQLGKTGITISGSSENLPALRACFAQQHYARLTNFLEPDFLEFIQSAMDGAEFYERVHADIASNKELCMTGNAGFGALLLQVNDEKLFKLIEDVTQCPHIGCFEGRVYRVTAGTGHHDSWHNDIGDHRLVAMSINLSREVYAGGVLQIRDRASGAIVSEVANVGPGDAIIFRLSDQLQHRITEVSGEVSKSAFAGWFKSEPDFPSLIRDRAQRGKDAQMLNGSTTFSSERMAQSP